MTTYKDILCKKLKNNEHVNVLHHFSFNMPLSGAEMTELEPLLCASSMRKGVKDADSKSRRFDKAQ